jgi:hypothetical protein
MDHDLFRLVYVSHASHEMTDPELIALLDQSRSWNQTVGITGALAYHDQSFLQVLEGPAHEVIGLFGRICLDRRNHGQVTIFREPVAERLFGDWSMGWLPAADFRHAGFNIKILFSSDPARGKVGDIFRAFRELGRAH